MGLYGELSNCLKKPLDVLELLKISPFVLVGDCWPWMVCIREKFNVFNVKQRLHRN